MTTPSDRKWLPETLVSVLEIDESLREQDKTNKADAQSI